MAEGFMEGFLAGQNDNNGNRDNGMFGGEGFMFLIVILALMGGNGFGGFGGGRDGGVPASKSDLCDGFNFNNLERNVQGIQNGLCDSTYAVTNTVNSGFRASDMATMQGFSGVDKELCALSHQLSDCCCRNERNEDQTRYEMAKGFCDVTRAGQDGFNQVLRRIDEMECRIESNRKDDRIKELELAVQRRDFQISQNSQNGYIDAIGNSIVNRIAPPPQPAYHVPAPFPYCGNGWQGNGGCNGGCGNGCC